jgi:hypothetical protein
LSFYKDRIVPYLVYLSMRQATLAVYRQRLVSAAKGRVLEIGVGSGLNLPHYGEKAVHIVGLDPSARLLSMANKMVRGRVRSVDLLRASAEAIPLAHNSVDTVVTTWTLCTIPDVSGALSRDASRAQAHRPTAVRRAWPFARYEGASLARSPHTTLETHRWRLPPQSRDQ